MENHFENEISRTNTENVLTLIENDTIPKQEIKYNANGRTELHSAAEKGNDVHVRNILSSLVINKQLLCHMINAPTNEKHKQTALHLAVKNGHLKVVGILLEYKARVNVRDENREGLPDLTPLHYAAEKGHLDVVKLLIEEGKAKIDAPDCTKGTPLQRALRLGQLSVVKYLVGMGAKVNSSDLASIAVLSCAAKAGYQQVAHFSVKENAEINDVGKINVTPLHHATKFRKWDIAKNLVERGADSNVKSNDSKTAVNDVVKAVQWGLAKCLIENGALGEGLTEKETTGSEFFRVNSMKLESEDGMVGFTILGKFQFLENYIRESVKSNSNFLTDVLPKAYEKIKLLNIKITQSVSLLIESQIIKGRLFSDRKVKKTCLKIDENHDTKISKNGVRKIKRRIHLIIQAIKQLKEISLSSAEISDSFLFLLKFITQNLQILRQQLRYSPDKLPWIEMQFCLVSFISVHTAEPKYVDAFSSLVLNRARLMNHIEHFEIELEKFRKDVKLGDTSPLTSHNPEIDSECFKDLYEDYELLRNICSLNRIASYLNPACSVDLKKGDVLVSEQVILRALQVTGECLKNTIESPNMSDKVHKFLITFAPKNARKIVTSLRDSLSHAKHLGKKIRVKVLKTFLLDIQSDLIKLRDEIAYILYLKRNLALEAFLKRISECASTEEAKEIISGVQCKYLWAIDMSGKGNVMYNKIGELVKEFKGEIEKTTKSVKIDFEELDNSLENLGSRFVNVNKRQKESMTQVYWLISAITNDEKIDLIRKRATGINYMFKYDPEIYFNWYEKISENIFVIYFSLEVRSPKVKELFSKLTFVLEFDAKAVKSIDILRSIMDNEESEGTEEIEKDVNNILENISNGISDKEVKNQFLRQIESKKAIFRSKNKLVNFYDKIYKIYNNIIYFYHNFGDIYNGVIIFLNLAFDFYNKKKADLTDEENKFIKLIDENKFNELFCELNLKNLINESAFKTLIDNIKTCNLKEHNFDDIFSDILLKIIDKNLFKNLLQKFRQNNFNLTLKITDEIKVEALIDENELKLLISEIKQDFLLDENNLGALANDVQFKFRKGETSDVVFSDFSLSNVKYILQNVKKIDGRFNSFGKLVKDKSKAKDHSMSIKAFCEFIKCLDVNFSKEIASAVEKAFEPIKNDEIVQLKNNFFKNFKILTKVFHNEKRDLELLALLKIDTIRLAVEMLVLTLLETLNQLSLLEPNQFYLDEFSPVLVGKNLRNYLAHGDPLINIIPTNYHISLINHFRLFKREFHTCNTKFYPRKKLIGKVPSFQRVKHYFQENLDILKEKNKLFERTTYNDVDDFKKFVDTSLYLKVGNYLGDTLLHTSALADNLGVFKHLRQRGLSVFFKNKYGHNAIYTAISKGSERIIEFLLNKGFDPSFIVEDSESLLHLAVQFGQLSIVKLLLSYGADITAVNKQGFNPIMKAVDSGFENIFIELLNAGSDIKSKDNIGRTLAHFATSNVKILKILLERNIDINAVDHDLNTPLHLACQSGEEAYVEMLLNNAANADNKNKHGNTALCLAAAEGHTKIVELLLLNTVVENFISAADTTSALITASLFGHFDIVELLLKNGTNLIARQYEISMALWTAAMVGDVRLIDLLLDYRANIDCLNGGYAALHIAAQYGKTEAFKQLVERGANIFLKGGSYEWSVLHFASSSGNIEMMKCILEKEDSLGKSELLNMMNNNRQTALHLAAETNKLQSVIFLIEKNADLETKDLAGRTPIFTAVSRGFTDIFNVLLKKKVNVKVKDSDGHSLVHIAALLNHLQIVNALIKLKVNVNVRSHNGSTPLHLAAQNGHLEMLKLLVRNGALTGLTYSGDYTAKRIAKIYKNFKVVGYLDRNKVHL